MVLTETAKKLFINYATEYNINPDSKKSDSTFLLLENELISNYGEDTTYRIIDFLCSTGRTKKIHIEGNLLEFEYEYEQQE